ncbi:MAG: RNA polymerase sigma factor [Idiomarina sp.]|nr:RNA polymerase sigma factor [Idiomarina sp.]
MHEQLTELISPLRRFAYSLTSSMADADDLVQMTVERLLTRDIPDDATLSQWAFRICRNLWIDEHRARQVRLRAAQNPDLQGNSTVTQSTEHEIELTQTQAAMAELPPAYRMVLSMVAIQGLSYQEVADALDIPAGTVMSRVARARIKLVELLNPPQRGAQA